MEWTSFLAGVGATVSSIKGIVWILQRLGFHRKTAIQQEQQLQNGHLQKTLGGIELRMDRLYRDAIKDRNDAKKRDEVYMQRFETIEQRLSGFTSQP